MDWIRFELMETAGHLVHLAIAYVLVLPIAWHRERAERSLGMRTFPLVAIASCSFLLLAQSTPDHVPADRLRVLQAVITGVSFLGGGIIIKQNHTVRGMATAAAIWTTTALGAAVAQRDYGLAVVVSLLTFVTLRWLESFKPLRDDPGAERSGE